jgi:hypothetical protein
VHEAEVASLDGERTRFRAERACAVGDKGKKDKDKGQKQKKKREQETEQKKKDKAPKAPG